MTNQKIRYAFSNLKNPDKNLQLAGRARDISDWLIGTNLTVAATKKYGKDKTADCSLTPGSSKS